MFNLLKDDEAKIITEITDREVNSTCSVDLESLSITNLVDLIQREPYNTDLLKVMFCSIQNAFVIKGGEDADETLFEANTVAVNESISKLTAISHGKFGQVMSVTFKHNDDIFIIKLPRKVENSGDVTNIHEFFVGLQLNGLRDKCPNFMYVFGLFNCLAPFNNIFANKICLDDSDNGIKKDFLIAEYIHGQELERIFMNVTVYDIMCIYYQILLALHIAWVMFDFTHYDLHVGNILTVNLDDYYFIPYHVPFKNGQSKLIYMRTRILVKIIDYGYSHIKYNGRDFGYIPAFISNPNIQPLDSSPISDLYRVTGSIAHQLLHYGNFDAFNAFWPMIYRFPSVKNAIKMEIGEEPPTPKNVAATMNELQEEFWMYSPENMEMETDSIFIDPIGLVDIDEMILYDAVPNGQKVYSCRGDCDNIESIRDILLKSTAAKKKRV
jgi:serine/threonine protein kinase